MKNLAKIIDRILKIEPALTDQLSPIKVKWEKTHRALYWSKLINVLNTEIGVLHPQRSLIQNVLHFKKKIPKKLHTFEPPSPIETILGVIPENMECRLRRHDHLQIEYAKITLEAKMTHNRDQLIDIVRKTEKLELDQKKVWLEIKDHFNLWGVDAPSSYFIRIQNGLLVLTVIKLGGPGRGPSNQNDPSEGGFYIKMDEDTLKKFFRYINTPLPPGIIPPESES